MIFFLEISNKKLVACWAQLIVFLWSSKTCKHTKKSYTEENPKNTYTEKKIKKAYTDEIQKKLCRRKSKIKFREDIKQN